MGKRRTGKIDGHAISRLIKQYGFEGNKYEAKIVLAEFGKLSKNATDRIIMTSENLEKTRLNGELKRKTKMIIVRNRSCDQRVLFIEKSFGKVVNVKHLFLTVDNNKGLFLPLRLRGGFVAAC